MTNSCRIKGFHRDHHSNDPHDSLKETLVCDLINNPYEDLQIRVLFNYVNHYTTLWTLWKDVNGDKTFSKRIGFIIETKWGQWMPYSNFGRDEIRIDEVMIEDEYRHQGYGTFFLRTIMKPDTKYFTIDDNYNAHPAGERMEDFLFKVGFKLLTENKNGARFYKLDMPKLEEEEE